jgi:hypothetical protein
LVAGRRHSAHAAARGEDNESAGYELKPG